MPCHAHRKILGVSDFAAHSVVANFFQGAEL